MEFESNIRKFKPVSIIQEDGDTKKKTIDISSIIREPDERYEIGSGTRYNVIKALKPTRSGERQIKYYILEKGCPVFQINEWLDLKNSSVSTGKKYAYIINRFLNYLDMRKKKYYEVNINDVSDYVLYRMYGGNDNVTLIKSRIRYKTITDDVMVIKMLYSWLSVRIGRVILETRVKTNHNSNYSYLFSEIGQTDYEELITKHLDSLPDSKRWLKWYSEEQIDAISSNFTTLRDKAIFLCTVDGGMRIDEVLSIKLSDYDGIAHTVIPSRSKTEIRSVVLTEKTCKLIDRYIMSERSDAEMESCKMCDYLFITQKKGPTQGDPLTYLNYYKILKRAGKKAGIDEDIIRTHSGRSTKVMELLEHQVLHPEDNITDNQIKLTMGWKNLNSLTPYRDNKNPVLAKSAQEKINIRKNSKECEDK